MILQMAFRAQKVVRAFEKSTPGLGQINRIETEGGGGGGGNHVVN